MECVLGFIVLGFFFCDFLANDNMFLLTLFFLSWNSLTPVHKGRKDLMACGIGGRERYNASFAGRCYRNARYS